MHELTESVKTKKLFGLPVFLAFFLKKKKYLFFLNLHVTLFFLFSPVHINICVYILVLSEEPVQS